jgi:hypothetical protein
MMDYLDVYGRTVLTWILKIGLKVYSELIWWRIGLVTACYEHGNEPTCSNGCNTE